jgi:hypothetical protein
LQQAMFMQQPFAQSIPAHEPPACISTGAVNG